VTATAAPGARKAALVFIFVTVLIDILAFGLIIPVLPHLLKEFVGGDTVRAAHWVGVFGVLFAAIQFVCAPLQGAMSDRFGGGRRSCSRASASASISSSWRSRSRCRGCSSVA